MKRDDYAFASTRVRMFEKTLLTKEQFQRLISQDSYEKSLRLLKETKYADLLSQLDEGNLDNVLDMQLMIEAQKLHELIKDEDLLSLLFLTYDYQNIKILIQKHFGEESLERLLFDFGSMDLETFRRKIDGDLPLTDSFKDQAIQEAMASYQEFGDPQALDEILDRYEFLEFAEIAKKSKIDFFQEYGQEMSDFTNLLTFLRLRRQGQKKDYFYKFFVPNGKYDEEFFLKLWDEEEEIIMKAFSQEAFSRYLLEFLSSQDITVLEKGKDLRKLAYVQETDQVIFGPEVLFGYFKKVETEIQNLRIILNGKKLGIQEDLLLERIRDYE